MIRLVSPVFNAAELFSNDDPDFHARLLTAMAETHSLTPTGFYGSKSADPDPKHATQALRKLSKAEAGIYGLACASIERDEPGMTAAAAMVLRKIMKR